MWTATLASAQSATGSNGPEATPELSSGSILAEVQTKGAHQVVSTLVDSPGKWTAVIRKIESGSPEWLRVAAALEPGSDAGDSEALSEAEFMALKHAPKGVLRLLRDEKLPTDSVCSAIAANDHPVKQAAHLIRERIAALSAVHDSSIQAVRDRCLKQLNNALDELSQEQ
jgi:hypothetical protein